MTERHRQRKPTHNVRSQFETATDGAGLSPIPRLDYSPKCDSPLFPDHLHENC